MCKDSYVKVVYSLTFLLFAAFSSLAVAESPRLAFSDLVSGPPEGLHDGLGEGAIVTIWGQNLKDGGDVFFIDSEGTRHRPHVYYWKQADGMAPSGPANLFESHLMYEIALSIPSEAAFGEGFITVTVDQQESNSLSFNVRPGEIYHVKSNGTDHPENGTWNRPWRSIAYAINKVASGGILYVHDVDQGSFANPQARGVYWNNTEAGSGLENQLAVISYPGYQPKVIAQKAFENYTTSGQVVSKFDVYASNYLSTDALGQPIGDPIVNSPRDTYGIQTSKNGRVIANRISDIPGGCASAWNGAINGAQERAHNVKILGNEIYDYGCNGSSKLHHTTYMSVRSIDNITVQPWEWGYNYLHGNEAKFGIHQYDEGVRVSTSSGFSEHCGDVAGVIKIHNNVIVDQAGAGISVGSKCDWTVDVLIENNTLVRVGLAAAWDGKNPNTSDGPENGGIALRDNGERGLTGDFYILNNLILNHTNDGQTVGSRGCLSLSGIGDSIEISWLNNICLSDKNNPFVGLTFDAIQQSNNITGFNNLWLNESVTPEFPNWDSNYTTGNPGIQEVGSIFSTVTDTNDILDTYKTIPAEIFIHDPQSFTYDIYGTRTTQYHLGPLSGYVNPPQPPTNILKVF